MKVPNVIHLSSPSSFIDVLACISRSNLRHFLLLRTPFSSSTPNLNFTRLVVIRSFRQSLKRIKQPKY
ncbi:hypothetical protein IMY05_002G0030200 [Salix suchowensis]|nr:hypothetical protein IMY05_002G0030200 [Salix suchowensis]